MFCLLTRYIDCPIVEEYLYSAMEDFKIDIMIESGPNARTVANLNPFTLIGATHRTSASSFWYFFSTTILYRGTIDYC
jgi:hypothetical protein